MQTPDTNKLNKHAWQFVDQFANWFLMWVDLKFIFWNPFPRHKFEPFMFGIHMMISTCVSPLLGQSVFKLFQWIWSFDNRPKRLPFLWKYLHLVYSFRKSSKFSFKDILDSLKGKMMDGSPGSKCETHQTLLTSWVLLNNRIRFSSSQKMSGRISRKNQSHSSVAGGFTTMHPTKSSGCQKIKTCFSSASV